MGSVADTVRYQDERLGRDPFHQTRLRVAFVYVLIVHYILHVLPRRKGNCFYRNKKTSKLREKALH